MKRLRTIVLGPREVGKTTFVTTMSERKVRNVPPTIGVDHVAICCRNTHFMCWDTSGDPKFKNVVKMFIGDCSVFLYIFDVTRNETLDQALCMYDQVVETISSSNVIHYLIGNKIDLPHESAYVHNRVIQFPELNYISVSAKNVEDTVALWYRIQNGTAHIQQKSVFQVEQQQSRECCGIQ